MNSTQHGVQAAAFRALLATGSPVSAAGLAAGVGTPFSRLLTMKFELLSNGSTGTGRYAGTSRVEWSAHVG